MKVAIGCDHGGFTLKPVLISYLERNGIEYKDFGCFSKDSVDYVDYAKEVSLAVQSKEFDRGILICGTGIGMEITANKFKGIRCAHCSDPYSARLTRLHNDANILAFGERVIGAGLAEDIIDSFLSTEFSNEDRHIRRINKIKEIEDTNFKK